MNVSPSPHLTKLLSDEAQLREDLANATSADERDCARADLATCAHSLWLAGYSPEEDA